LDTGYQLTKDEVTKVELRLQPVLGTTESLLLVVRGHNSHNKSDVHAVTNFRMISLSLKKPDSPLIIWELADFESVGEVKMISTMLRYWDGSTVNIGWLSYRRQDAKLFVDTLNAAIQSQSSYEFQSKQISERVVRQIGYKFPDETGRLIARRVNPFMDSDELVLFAGTFAPQRGIAGDMIVLTQARIMIFEFKQFGEIFSTVYFYSNIARCTWTGSELLITDNLGNRVALGKLRHDKQDLNVVKTILEQHIVSARGKEKVDILSDQHNATTPPQRESFDDREQVQSSVATFDIRLDSVPSDKITVIKSVRSLTGLGLQETLDVVESAPVILFRNVSQTRALELRDELEESSAEISVIPNHVPSTSSSESLRELLESEKGVDRRFRLPSLELPEH